MINPHYYQDIYLAVVSILTIVAIATYSRYDDDRLYGDERPRLSLPALLLTIAVIIFIGYRPISGVFVDMVNYREYYYALRHSSFVFNPDAQNYLFDNVFTWMASSGMPILWFYVMCAAVNFGLLFVACRKLFPQDTYLAIVVYLGAFSTFSYATNGIKAGMAASAFLCAIAYRRQWIIAALFMLISLGIHHSMTLCIGAYLCAYFYTNTKVYLWAWFIAVILAVLNFGAIQDFFASLTDESGAGYLATQNMTDWGGKSGFRLDFLIYSAMPVAIGYYAIIRCRLSSKMYSFIFNTYLVANTVWMLCMHANFTNRIAYLSWLMLPIVMIYPYLRCHFVRGQYRKLNYVVMGHLLFTLAMSYLYYGILA